MSGLEEQMKKLARLPPNKSCADCGQKGTTYVNVSAGTFVCSGCSSVLLSLSTPQRVKSVSLSKFSPDEVKFVASHGNAAVNEHLLGRLGSDVDVPTPQVCACTGEKVLVKTQRRLRPGKNMKHNHHSAL
eukprot:m.142679 g.142679  ORF g.142679 m.142679 type:complete len:130 (-) comp20411_c2_seq5:301-690(-)